VLVKDDKKIVHIYELKPDECPCKECIVKITCTQFCSLIYKKIKKIGNEINV